MVFTTGWKVVEVAIIMIPLVLGVGWVAYLVYADSQNLQMIFQRKPRSVKKREERLQHLKMDIAEDELIEQRREQQVSQARSLESGD